MALWSPDKLNIELPFDLAFPLPSIHPKELKTDVQRETCTQMLTALFIITKMWK